MNHEKLNLGWRGPLPANWESRLGWVYIIEHAGLYKIGYARNVDTRLRQLRTAAPMLKEVFRIPSLSYRELEKLIHDMFLRERRVGEWFELSESNLKFLSKCDGEGRILFSKGVSYLYERRYSRS
jgi:hypothetical protein